MFITEAFADTAATATPHSSATSILTSLVPFVLIFVVFYLLLILPQRRKQKAHKLMLGALKAGDKIVLNSGIVGKVVKIKNEQFVVIKTAETTELEVLRSAIVNIVKE